MSDELTREDVQRIVENFPPEGRRTIRACEAEMRVVMQKYGAFFGHWALTLIEMDLPLTLGLFPEDIPEEEGPISYD
jgi:hypothetical protein